MNPVKLTRDGTKASRWKLDGRMSANHDEPLSHCAMKMDGQMQSMASKSAPKCLTGDRTMAFKGWPRCAGLDVSVRAMPANHGIQRQTKLETLRLGLHFELLFGVNETMHR